MPIRQDLVMVTVLVRDYAEAIHYFTNILGFELVEDTPMTHTKRWVVVRPRGSSGACLLLARAASREQEASIGKQAGGRVGFFLHVDDFQSEYLRLLSLGVHFLEQPRQEDYGRVAVFSDLYGNRWDLIEPIPSKVT